MAAFQPLVVPPPGAGARGRWYVVGRGVVLVDDDSGGIVPGDAPEVAGAEDPVFLGLLGGEPCWALGADSEAPAPAGRRWAPLRHLGMEISYDEWALAGRAVQLVEWLRTSRFCGRCATPTELSPGERAMRCPACGLSAYPRLAPAIIVLVERGDEVLLAKGRGFGRMFSTVAGFVEPGETLEEAVHREVAEEVGVSLGAVRYFDSQPWPFPHSLMVGFFADWADGDIRVDGDEIVDAAWFRAGALPDIPPRLSIARRLIDNWCARTAP
jgi:NAD+ diphosphatase